MAASGPPAERPLLDYDAGEPAAVDSRRLLAVSRTLHPGRSWGAYLQTIYMGIFTLGLSAVLFWSLWKKLASFFVDVASPYHFIWGAAAVALLLLVALRFSTMQGFVSYSEADCVFLLSAPVSRAGLVRPRLRRITISVMAAGALIGLLAGLASHGRAAGGVRMLEGMIGGAALGAIIVSAGWQVQRLPRLSIWVQRLTLPALAAVGLLAYADRRGGDAHLAALWSGPWGWGLLPLGASAAWAGAVGVALLCVLAIAGWLSARSTAGKAALEGFITRAQTRSQATAALYALDARSVMLAARRPWAEKWRARLRYRPPRRPELAVAWHGSLVLLRSPIRLGWALALAAAAPLLLGTHPGNTGMSWAAALALYLAASSLVEPLRLEVDQSATSHILLPWRFGKTLLLHCVLPLCLLLATGLVATVVGWAAGFVHARALGALAVLALPVTAASVASAALSARRGGRLPEHMLFVGAGDTTGFSAFILIGWIFGWTIVGIVATGLASLALRGSIALEPVVLATVLTATAAVILSFVLTETKR